MSLLFYPLWNVYFRHKADHVEQQPHVTREAFTTDVRDLVLYIIIVSCHRAGLGHSRVPHTWTCPVPSAFTTSTQKIILLLVLTLGFHIHAASSHLGHRNWQQTHTHSTGPSSTGPISAYPSQKITDSSLFRQRLPKNLSHQLMAFYRSFLDACILLVRRAMQHACNPSSTFFRTS